MVFWSFSLTASFLRRERFGKDLFFSSSTGFGYVLKVEQERVSISFQLCILPCVVVIVVMIVVVIQGGETNHLFHILWHSYTGGNAHLLHG